MIVNNEGDKERNVLSFIFLVYVFSALCSGKNALEP